jgi:hypothetical protein
MIGANCAEQSVSVSISAVTRHLAGARMTGGG